MKSFLHARVSQSHHLTPQLQSAIRLLQLSTLDLKQKMLEQAELNPMLDVIENDLVSAETTEQEPNTDDFDNEAVLHLAPSSTNVSGVYDPPIPTPFTLQDYLRWQLALTSLSEIDKWIGWTIIDAVNEDGFLTVSTDELQTSLSLNHPITLTELEAVRHLIQHMDPIGCAAVSLSDTLLVQLNQLPNETPYLGLARTILKENIRLLEKNHHAALMKNYQIDETTLEQILSLIQKLNPKPGNSNSLDTSHDVIPDLIVRKIDALWKVELNTDLLPHLSVNPYYATLFSRTNNQAEYQFLKFHLQEAHWFLKSIQQRQKTLLKVARYLVNYQKGFLELGDSAMRPLTLLQVANALNTHESTISRITTQKFIETPRGLFELKYFFSSHVNTSLGKPYSSIAIKDMIKKLIAKENRTAPLSDKKIAMIISTQGVSIARRTITKYREEMLIPTSRQRYLTPNA